MKLNTLFLLGITAVLGLSACGEQKVAPATNSSVESIATTEKAEFLQDNENTQPQTDVTKSKPKTPKQENVNIEPVDINTATAEELIKALKGTGVGAAKVANIIEYRSKNNGFKSIEELNEVKGIGDKTLEKMRSRVKISNSNVAKNTNNKVNKVSEDENSEEK